MKAACFVLALAVPAAAMDHAARPWLVDGRASQRSASVLTAGSESAALALVRARLAPGVTLVERHPDGGPHRVFDQYFQGTRVAGGVLTLTAGPRRALVVGHPVTGSKLSPGKSRLDAAAAARRALAHLGSPKALTEVQPVVASDLEPAFEVKVQSRRPPLDARVVVDARTGAILHADDLAGAVDGKASVYRTHPLDCQPTVEPIGDLNPGGRLKGKYVEVENGAGIDASSSTNEFIYPPANKHLDEANVYYHIQRVHHFLRDRFGYTGLDDAPLAAGTYYGEDLDNAYYVPWGHYVVFGGGGQRYNVLSRDATVVYHEYTHAMTNRVAGLGSVGAAALLSEGYSDYIAATITGDPRIAVWTVAKEHRPYMRTLDNRFRVPEDLKNESHWDSQIWSGLLWDLRKQLGADVVDALAYRALHGLNSEATLPAAVQALLVADDALNKGAHGAAITAAAAARGL